jgi:hypothetical protein
MENCKRNNALHCENGLKENRNIENDIKCTAAKAERKAEITKEAIKEKSQEIGR